MSSIKVSFRDKRVSKNAVFTLITGIGTLTGYLILILYAAVTGGHLPLAGGLFGCLLGILAFFGVLWGVVCFDDVRTTQQFKVSGIVLNIISVFLAITFIMV